MGWRIELSTLPNQYYRGGHGNRLIGALETLRQRIEPIHKRLSTVIIENLDWRTCIDRYDRENTVMYLNPPYPGNGVNYFHNMRNWDEHHVLAERLKRTKCKWILSSYDTPEVHDLFSIYPVTRVESSSGMKTKKDSKERVINREVLVTNYEPRTSHPLKQRAKSAAAQQLPLFREYRRTQSVI